MKSQKLLLALSLLLSTATTARAAEEGELCWEKCFRVMAGSHYRLQICCNLQWTIAFLQGDRKFSISCNATVNYEFAATSLN